LSTTSVSGENRKAARYRQKKPCSKANSGAQENLRAAMVAIEKNSKKTIVYRVEE
jgi:hypothetical protein